ncbi:hypothetical protein [Curtobacterium citreum]|uniref:hypothetical protein n=1 Tax=Curtobacterium citreum TaxID=2036 RepID=UPI0007375B11|nr:hypothetical protein [Curtobacterium citreum]KTR11065.1 hypothetical protein NS330_12950 [Curtobacterium citreum]
MGTEYKRLQQRGRNETDLLAEDEVPLAGEIIVASDTGKTWPGDGVTPLTALPFYALVVPSTGQLSDELRDVLASNLADPETPEGSAIAGIATGISFDQANSLYRPPTGPPIPSVDPATSLPPDAVLKALDQRAAVVDGQRTFTSQDGLRSSTWFGLGAGKGSARMPFYMNSLLNAAQMLDTLAAPGADDYVGVQMNVKMEGDYRLRTRALTGSIAAGSTTVELTAGTFSAPIIPGYMLAIPGAGPSGGTLRARINSITDTTHAVVSAPASTAVAGSTITASLAADPTFLFGKDEFFTTGTAQDDLKGIQYVFGSITELHIAPPNLSLLTVIADSTEIGLEASAGGSVDTIIGHRVKGITNSSSVTPAHAYGLYVEPNTASKSPDAWSAYVNGKTKIGAMTLIVGSAASDPVLRLQAPLNPTTRLFEVYDVTGTNRLMYVGSGGAVASAQDVAAREGLGTSTIIGSMSGGFAGIRMGPNGVEIAQTSPGVARVQQGKAFGLPAVTTAARASAVNAGAGAMTFDTTIGKLIYSDGTAWRDVATGTTV